MGRVERGEALGTKTVVRSAYLNSRGYPDLLPRPFLSTLAVSSLYYLRALSPSLFSLSIFLFSLTFVVLSRRLVVLSHH